MLAHSEVYRTWDLRVSHGNDSADAGWNGGLTMPSDAEHHRPQMRRILDWALVGLTWLPAVGMVVLFLIDTFSRYILNSMLNFEAVGRLLAFFGILLLIAVFFGAALTLADWRAGRRRVLTTLVVWPGLPIAGALAGLGFIGLAITSRGFVAPVEILSNPLAAQSHGAIYMAAAVAALAFGSRDRQLTAVAAAPTALLILPYLSAELSISGGIMAQFASLTAVVISGIVAAVTSRRLWPVAAVCGAAIFWLVYFPILVSILTPTEAFALACTLVAIPALIFELVTKGRNGLVLALHSGAREIAGLAAVIACASVVPMLLNLLGLPIVRIGDLLGQVPATPLVVTACLVFVALATVLTPLLVIALIGALGAVGGISSQMQGLQAAILAATVPLGLAAMALREAYAARISPADALLPEKTALLLGGVLMVIGCAAAVLMRRIVSFS